MSSDAVKSQCRGRDLTLSLTDDQQLLGLNEDCVYCTGLMTSKVIRWAQRFNARIVLNIIDYNEIWTSSKKLWDKVEEMSMQHFGRQALATLTVVADFPNLKSITHVPADSVYDIHRRQFPALTTLSVIIDSTSDEIANISCLPDLQKINICVSSTVESNVVFRFVMNVLDKCQKLERLEVIFGWKSFSQCRRVFKATFYEDISFMCGCSPESSDHYVAFLQRLGCVNCTIFWRYANVVCVCVADGGLRMHEKHSKEKVQ